MPGTYFLTVTDSLGCSTTDSVYVDIYNSGCTDTAATNFDPTADGICNTLERSHHILSQTVGLSDYCQ